MGIIISGVVKCGNIKNSEGSKTIITPSIKKYPTFLDVLKEDLLNQEWNENEKPCHDQIIRILTNVQNSTLWATWSK